MASAKTPDCGNVPTGRGTRPPRARRPLRCTGRAVRVRRADAGRPEEQPADDQ